MNNILLKNVNVVLPDQKLDSASILVGGSNITQIFDGEPPVDLPNIHNTVVDLSGSTIYPGFIDIHTHGAIGIDVNDASSENLSKASQFLLSKGVTAWLPTLVPDTQEKYLATIQSIDRVSESEDNLFQARILGVHYEGVFANKGMCGALRPEYFRKFNKGDEIGIPRLKNGVHFTTLAPEIENGIELIEKLVEEGWIVSVGHTDADVACLEQAKKSGVRHFTHFFNAMTGLHHREVGVAGWVLANTDAGFDIIADEVHVHPKMLELAVRIKTPEKVSLISDSIAPTGLGDGDYEVWGEKISVVDGKTQNERGSFAGSVITMLDAVNVMLSLGFTEVEVAKMAARNPARLLGLENSCGTAEVGKRADFVGLDSHGNVTFAMVGGRYKVYVK